MIRLDRYLKMQIKEAFSCFFKGLAGMILLIILSAAVILGVYTVRKNSGQKIINIGIVASDDSLIDDLMEMAGGMSGIENLCSFSYMDKDSAMAGLEDGSLAMVCLVPDDFYQKAVSMQQTSIDIYTGSEMTVTDRKVLAIIKSVEEMMITTEGAIHSMYDGMEVYSFPVSSAQMEMELFGDILSEYIDRDSEFDIEYVSPYGQFSFIQFYMVSALILITGAFGVAYFGIYTEGNREIEKLCTSKVSGKISISMIKIIAMTIPTGLFMSVLTAGLMIITKDGGLIDKTLSALTGQIGSAMTDQIGSAVTDQIGSIGVWAFAAVWVTALSEAVIIQLVVSICGSGKHSATIYWLIMGLVMAISGVVIPMVYLPDLLRNIGEFLPAANWQGMLLKGFWGRPRRGFIRPYITRALLTDLAVTLISSIIYIRRLKTDD